MVGIYKITSPSGKVYIGQSRKIAARFGYYRRLNSKGQRLLHNSFLKYGVENHIFEVVIELPEDVSLEVLNNYENVYWQQYKDLGFTMLNLQEPGNQVKVAEETKALLRAKRFGKDNPMYGRPMSEENKEILRKRWSGPNNSFYGKDMSGANNPSFGSKRSKEWIENRVKLISKPVLQYNLSGELIAEWASAKEAAKAIGASQGNIWQVVNGMRQTAAGSRWQLKTI